MVDMTLARMALQDGPAEVNVAAALWNKFEWKPSLIDGVCAKK
jgi:hypothetical protein